MIKEVIVVEGRHDTDAVLRAVKADTIETGGSAISKEIIEQIRLAYERRGVIVLTDPDYSGERIRKIISQQVPGVKHAFISQDEGLKKGDIGVENATPEVIRNALSKVRTEVVHQEFPISWEDFVQLGLVGGSNSSQLRDRIAKILRIGKCNAKQFYRRLSLFQISKKELMDAYEQAVKGGR